MAVFFFALSCLFYIWTPERNTQNSSTGNDSKVNYVDSKSVQTGKSDVKSIQKYTSSPFSWKFKINLTLNSLTD